MEDSLLRLALQIQQRTLSRIDYMTGHKISLRRFKKKQKSHHLLSLRYHNKTGIDITKNIWKLNMETNLLFNYQKVKEKILNFLGKK